MHLEKLPSRFSTSSTCSYSSCYSASATNAETPAKSLSAETPSRHTSLTALAASDAPATGNAPTGVVHQPVQVHNAPRPSLRTMSI